MRWLLAMIKHETNTFSPVPTPLERFFRGSPEILAGERAIRAYENTDSGLGGYIEVARREGAEIVVPVAAESWPSAPTDRATYERLCGLVLDEARRGGFDAILLDLHGAMVAEGVEDAEGDLLRRLRDIAPAIPVGVTLDMHANIYDDIVRHATVISGFHTYPHVDIREAGLSAVVCTDANLAQAEQYRDELLETAWRGRADWVFHAEPLAPTIARAKAIENGPVVLLDHYDNTGSGGTMDTTAVLAEILDQGLENVAFYAICDPQAAQQAAAAGVGATVTLPLGGKVAMPALRQASPPLHLTARVKLLFDGVYLNRGPMYRGVRNDTGLTVVLDTGKVEIVVVSRHQEPFDINCLLSAGIDPLQKRYVALKSRVHWRAGFADMATHVIECTGVGVTTSDYGQVEFRHVRRPVYPLDAI
ncbi:M81 family metallopeptidase [Bordetella bronchiseptica]|uniref:M81 family metallopeptidase n=1 Tax=Bordetella bronchiseptica TaxID=518 RepID=UPI000460B927|nr:M81 family metallopeptidase [Bordetella bronchiseptica]AWP73713.1 microcystin degradation protein MlrC [Bordetella bronchiseptica]KDB95616.1 MlrC C-terminal domain protein [Bordetella bronchiseptica D993]KDB99673.1 MlrC C-terminal domain protein [Bordetella bronchiseptica E010]KDD33579.1 MlrC C-terminal domain protein [Bordetella bronchiseptica MBORD839]KFJ62978.1 hypothetical protein DK45_3473 [Bordetella bronchiseptica]